MTSYFDVLTLSYPNNILIYCIAGFYLFVKKLRLLKCQRYTFTSADLNMLGVAPTSSRPRSSRSCARCARRKVKCDKVSTCMTTL